MKDKALFILVSLVYILFASLFWIPLVLIAIPALPYMILVNFMNKDRDKSGFGIYIELYLLLYKIIQEEVTLYKLAFEND